MSNLRGSIAGSLQRADHSDANLSYTNLRGVNLRAAYLRVADLSNTYLHTADLSSADLRAANFANSILLATDLRNTQNLQIIQLTGKEPPLLCNVALPPTFTGVDPNKDCGQVSQAFANRYNVSLDEAVQWVNGAKQKQWN